MTVQPTSVARYHGLDGLRAAMMLLGLVLHAVASYVHVPLRSGWPYQDDSQNAIWSHLLLFIHVYRMPVFFVMAGFFAVLLVERRGVAKMVWNRTTRILVPFLVGWIVLEPLTQSGFVFANSVRGATLSEGWAAVRDMTFAAWFQDSTIHLWFLYYLLTFYVSGLILSALVQRLPASWRRGGLHLFGRLVQSRYRPLWFAIPSAGILAVMPMGLIKTSTSFVPDWQTFGGYAVYFGFGWLLYHRRDLLPTFQRDAWKCVALGLALTPINLAAAERGLMIIPEVDHQAAIVAAVTGALIVWLFVFGLTGLFDRYLNRPIPSVRYVVDASYWVYLIHLPFTIWIPGLLANLAWPSTIKILAMLVVATPVWWFTYNLFVRNTWIGVLLNGRRYPRGFPVAPAGDRPAESTPHGAGAYAAQVEPAVSSAVWAPPEPEDKA